MPTYTPLLLNSREMSLRKAIVSPEFGSKTVLTNEPWNFVDLALAREQKTDARFYWQQAKEFYLAAQGVSLQSAPLLLYYAYMNAAKTLLAARGLLPTGRIYHGVKRWSPTPSSRGLSRGVEFGANGVAVMLSDYYSESETSTTHSLKEMFFNMPFIHRTYCLTYTSQDELFVPLCSSRFAVENGTNNVFFTGELSAHYPLSKYLGRLPPCLAHNPSSAGGVISTSSVPISSVKCPTTADVVAIADFARSLREDIYYINGTEALWYVKATTGRNARLQRQTTTLTLAAMHSLSDICRYAPMQMVRLLEGQQNWLLSEFIKMSGNQFIDEIASEVTGMQFLIPNVRSPT